MDDATVFQRVIAAAGGIAALAKAVGASPQQVMNWKERGFPANYCQRIHRLTGVGLHELRPDDWADYWPDWKAPKHSAATKRKPRA